MASPYIIKVGSQKGGVGKTTVSVNLATTLSLMNYKVLVVDADTINPSVGFYLGLEDVNIGYMDAAKRKVSLAKSIIKHEVTGMEVLPGTPHSNPTLPTHSQLAGLTWQIRKMRYDFVVVDTPPGMYVPGTSRLYDEAVIITTPEMSSTTTAARLGHIYSKEGLRHSLIINRVRDKRYELSIEEIEEAYRSKAQAVLPEDEIVPKSMSLHVPAVLLGPRAPFSAKVKTATRFYASKMGSEALAETAADVSLRSSSGGGILGWLMRLFRLR